MKNKCADRLAERARQHGGKNRNLGRVSLARQFPNLIGVSALGAQGVAQPADIQRLDRR